MLSKNGIFADGDRWNEISEILTYRVATFCNFYVMSAPINYLISQARHGNFILLHLWPLEEAARIG